MLLIVLSLLAVVKLILKPVSAIELPFAFVDLFGLIASLKKLLDFGLELIHFHISQLLKLQK